MYFERIKNFLRSIRVRLTFLFLLLLGTSLTIFCTVLYQVFIKNHQQEFDFALYNHTVDVAQSISVDFFGDFTLNSNIHLTREKIFPFSTGRSFVQIVSLDGQVVYKSHNLGSSALLLDSQDWQAVFQKGFIFRTVTSTGDDVEGKKSDLGSYRQITYLVRRGKPLFLLQIAVPLTMLEAEANNLVLFFAKGVPITLIIAGLFCFYLAHRSLSPMREIVHRAERLSPFRLSERIPETGTKDEIDNLTITLNRMLSRIEKAFKTHENFIADASHQLKTPLAIVRGELDLLKGKEKSPDQVKLFYETAQQELQHMSRLIDHLLLLAKIDAGAGSLTMSPLRLDEILIDVISRLEVLATKKEISIKLDLKTDNEKSEFVIKGDQDLIQSMFSNLIDNAIKYSPEKSSIELIATNESEKVIVDIRDSAPPIPSDDLERLFHRYERGTTLLGSGAKGTGLGLPIAQKIAELHSGKILILQENPHSKCFRVEIKKL